MQRKASMYGKEEDVKGEDWANTLMCLANKSGVVVTEKTDFWQPYPPMWDVAGRYIEVCLQCVLQCL